MKEILAGTNGKGGGNNTQAQATFDASADFDQAYQKIVVQVEQILQSQ